MDKESITITPKTIIIKANGSMIKGTVPQVLM